jgi:hypothetical protein
MKTKRQTIQGRQEQGTTVTFESRIITVYARQLNEDSTFDIHWQAMSVFDYNYTQRMLASKGARETKLKSNVYQNVYFNRFQLWPSAGSEHVDRMAWASTE